MFKRDSFGRTKANKDMQPAAPALNSTIGNITVVRSCFFARLY